MAKKKKTTLAELGKLLKQDKTKGDTSYWGVVQSVNTDSQGKVTSYNVNLGGSTGTTKCRKLAGAKVNDTVLVTLRSTGEAVVVGTKNGDTDVTDVATDLDENYSTTEEVEEMIAEGGGNTIYYQTTAPTGGTYSTGDTWFDTDNGYAIYRWNGTQWVKSELNSDAFAAGCIVASKIASGAITSGKISANAVTIGKLGSDVTGEIDDAAATATAYITADTTGIKVRNSTSSTSYVHISSSAIDIYSNGTKVATMNTGGIEISPDLDDPSSPHMTLDGSTDEIYASTLNLVGARGINLDANGNTVDVTGTLSADYVTSNDTTAYSAYAGRGTSGEIGKKTSSSKRFKENITSLSDEQTERIHKLYDVEVKSWNYRDDYIAKDDDFYQKTIFGLIAEDVVEVMPEIEELDGDGEIANYKDIILVNAMLKLLQEQHEEIETLKARVDTLENI